MKISDVAGPRYKHLSLPDDKDCPVNHKDYVPSEINDTDLICVGEAPGEKEVAQQRPFVGRSGQLLRENLEQVGITTASFSNIVRCRPEGNKDPSTGMISCCMSRTAAEVDGYPFVLLLGNTAINQFFPDAKPKHIRGNACVHPDYPGQRFYGFYHPAWAARKGSAGRKVFRQAMERLKRVMEGEGPDMEVTRAGSDAYNNLLDEMLSAKKIAFDIETNKLETWHPDFRIKSLALTDDGHRVAFCHEEDGAFTSTLDKVAQFLATEGKQVIGHNIGFDIEAVEQRARITARCRPLDTMDLWYHVDDYRMPSLKQLTSEQLDGYRHLVPNPEQDVESDKLALYNAEDVIYPWDLFHRGVQQLDNNQLNLYMNLASRATLFTQRISANGLFFDRDRWLEVKEEVVEEIQEEAAAWLEIDPDASILVREDFDPERHKSITRGTQALKKYIFEVKGLEVVEETDKGNPSVNKDALRTYVANGQDQLQHLLNIRELEKLKSTYVGGGPHDGYEAHVDAFDGRIHSSYMTALTDSGRLSSRSPNCQNPARDIRIRSLFGVRAGRTFIKSDLSQIEMRIMLCLAGDQEAMRAYQRGVDAHLQTAMEITGKDDPGDITKEERTLAKPVNFGLCVPQDGTEILTKDGWKTHDEVEEGDKTLGYEDGRLVWTPIKAVVRFEDRDLVRMSNSRWAATTTPGHRWFGDKWVDQGSKGHKIEEQFFTTEDMTGGYRIHISKRADIENQLDISPEEAALIGWGYTDGSINWSELGPGPAAGVGGWRRGVSFTIFQSEKKYADEIRKLLAESGLEHNERKTREDGLVSWYIPAHEARDLLRRAGLENGKLECFVRRLGTEEIEAFAHACELAEATKNDGYSSMNQKSKEVTDAVHLAWFLLGNSVNRYKQIPYKEEYNDRQYHVLHKESNSRVTGHKIQKENIGKGDVWCVTTEAGTWTMRQEGRIMVTGNCYGGEWYTVQDQARSYGFEWDRAKCERFVDAFFRRFPKLESYHREIIRDLRGNKGWVQDAVGHKHHYEHWNAQDEGRREHAERSAINAMGQGPASYITERIGMIAQQEIREQCLHPHILLVNPVHDELDWSVKDDYIPELLEIVDDAVHQTKRWVEDWFDPPLVMDFEAGPNWGEMEDMTFTSEA